MNFCSALIRNVQAEDSLKVDIVSLVDQLISVHESRTTDTASTVRGLLPLDNGGANRSKSSKDFNRRELAQILTRLKFLSKYEIGVDRLASKYSSLK